MLATNRSSRCCALLAALLLVDAGVALAADGDDAGIDRTPKDCLALPRVRSTDVIDDETILFVLRGNSMYLNHLPRKCPGLARQNRFMYQTTSARLCSIDTITVLEQWAARLTPGFTCRLGQFHPITRDEVEDLKAATREEGGKRPAVKTEPVELPPDKDAGDAAARATPEASGTSAAEADPR